MTLNPHSPIPLYLQLAERLRQQITSEAYPVDQRIPSEHQLANQYRIGRPTVRQATDLLVREGRLERRRGSGTYVTRPAPRLDLLSLAGTSAALRESRLDGDFVTLQPPVKKTHRVQTPVSFDNGAYHLKRVARIDAGPVMLESIYLDAEIFNGIDEIWVQGSSLSRTIRDHYYLEASSAEQSFKVLLANTAIARALSVKPQTALLHVARTIHFDPYDSAIYCDIYCRTDHFDFSQTITAVDRHNRGNAS